MAKTKTPGIYTRKDSKNYWIAYADLDGNIVRESTKTKNFKEASVILTQRRQMVLEGKKPELKRIKDYSFNDLCEIYLPWASKQKAFKSKALKIKQLSNEFKNLKLRQFNTMLVEQFQSKRLSFNKPATVNRLLATLKHMFTKAVEWEMVEEEILKKVRRVKNLQENNRRLNYLTKEQIRNLTNECPNHLKPIVIMALNTGMRKGEILKLKWENINLTQGFIHLSETKNGEKREIRINGTLEKTLRKLVPRLDTPYVFYSKETGKPFKDIKTSFNSACRRAGIIDFVFHDLRHTFASHLVMSGVDLATVKEMLGHKTLSMSLRYAHLSPGHQVNAINALDKAING